MKLKLDENLGGTAVSVFQSAGHDTQTVRGQGLSGATDHKIVAACQTERRCLVTLDLDFANPLRFDPACYSGIAVIRLPHRLSQEDLMDACHTLVAGMGKAQITGKLWIIQRGRIREYQREDNT